MSHSAGSFFVVKRKADEEEVFGGKRLRLLGSYTSKPNEDDIVSHVGRKALGKKRVIIQDFDTHEFKQFISELPEKKTKTDDQCLDETLVVDSQQDNHHHPPHNNNNHNHHSHHHHHHHHHSQNQEHNSPARIVANQPPRIGLNLNAAERVTSTPRKVTNKQSLFHDHLSIPYFTPETDIFQSNTDDKKDEKYVYDVYGIDEDCLLDFGTTDDPDEYDYGDVDSDENDENWRGNDYPDDESENATDNDNDNESDDSYGQDVHFCQGMDRHTELYDFELDDFRKFALHDTDDEFGNGNGNDHDDDDE